MPQPGKTAPLVDTVERPNATCTSLDAEIRQMWLDLLRWISEGASERVIERAGPVGVQQRGP